MSKTFTNTSGSDAKAKVRDLVTFGDPDTWRLISKAGSQSEGWMKSTKALAIFGKGVMIQVTTQQGDRINEFGHFLDNVVLIEYEHQGEVFGRTLKHAERLYVPGEIVKVEMDPEDCGQWAIDQFKK